MDEAAYRWSARNDGNHPRKTRERIRKWRLGINTRGQIDLGHDDSCFQYEGTDYSLLDRALQFLRQAEEDVVFLDYGCGKGRAVLAAGMRPFWRVIGVELDQGMIQHARNNLAVVHHRMTCRDVELIATDATRYVVPDDVNAAFMFNPFGGPVLDAVIARIRASLDRCSRKTTLFFIYPPEYETDPFEELGWCSRITEIPVPGYRKLRFLVYQT